MALYCLATVYAPDPQDCGDPAVAVDGGWPLCQFHLDGLRWAEANA